MNTAAGTEQVNQDTHIGGSAGLNGSSNKDDQRRPPNKRKADVSNGHTPLAPPSPAPKGPPRITRNALGGPASLPPRPSPATVVSGRTGILQDDRDLPPHQRDRGLRPSSAVSARPASAGLPQAGPSALDSSAPRFAKRPRKDNGAIQAVPGPGSAAGEGNAQTPGEAANKRSGTDDPATGPKVDGSRPTPSLLSRLTAAALSGKNPAQSSERARDRDREQGSRRQRRGGEKGSPDAATVPAPASAVPAKRRAEAPPLTSAATPLSGARPVQPPSSMSSGRPRQRESPGDPDKDPVVGFSIRGAAKAASRTSPSAGEGTGSLLQRMQPQREGSSHSSDGGRRKKKAKHSKAARVSGLEVYRVSCCRSTRRSRPHGIQGLRQFGSSSLYLRLPRPTIGNHIAMSKT